MAGARGVVYENQQALLNLNTIPYAAYSSLLQGPILGNRRAE